MPQATQQPDHPDEVRLANATPAPAAPLIGRICHPLYVGTTLVVVSAISTAGILMGAKWAAIALFFCVLLPFGAVHLLTRLGQLTDTQVVRREQRLLPHIVAITCIAAGFTTLSVLGAPGAFIAVIISMFCGLVVTATVSTLMKISIHSSVFMHTAATLAVLTTPWLLIAAFPMWVAVAWARVNEGRHTTVQVLLGGLVGALNGAVVFSAFLHMLG